MDGKGDAGKLMGRKTKAANRPFTIDTDPSSIGLVSQTTETAFGQLHIVGPAQRQSDEAMLFLHGFGSSWSVWTPLIKAARSRGLLGREDIILVDLPGFNKSDNRKGHLKSAEVGRELLGVLQKRGYTSVRVVGHSMGGFLALDIAARNPEVVTSVHVVSGTYLALMRAVRQPLKSTVRDPSASFFYFMQKFFSSSPAAAKLANDYIAKSKLVKGKPLYTLGGPAFKYASQNAIGYDSHQMWGTINMPVYAVFGARDRLVSQKDMKEFQAILPQAKTTLIADTGHSSLVDWPHQVAAALFSELN